MQYASKILAWILIISMLFMGCYTSTIINTEGSDRKEISSGRIESLVLKDSSQYVFQVPARIINDTVVGTSYGRSVKVPLSAVAKVTLKRSDPVKTAFLVLGIGAGAVVLYWGIYWAQFAWGR